MVMILTKSNNKVELVRVKREDGGRGRGRGRGRERREEQGKEEKKR